MRASQVRQAEQPRKVRRTAVAVMAAAGALSVSFAGLAPAAVAQDASSKQWYLDAMQAEAMWKVSTGKGMKIAVIDSGVEATASLEGRLLPGKDVSGLPGEAQDDFDGHGTSMAEFIAGTGKNGGLRGLAPDAKIIPIRSNEGDEGTDSKRGSTLEAALRAAADTDAQIINMSLGSPYWTAGMEKAVKYAAEKGKLLFASVGNNAKKGNKPNYPAKYPEVAAIGADSESGKVADFSQFGDVVDLTAPGTNVALYCDKQVRTYCDGDIGTSGATALASASAALIWSKNPDWTANQVLRVLITTAGRDDADAPPSKYIGYGTVRPRLNVLEGKGEPGDPNVHPLLADSPTAGESAPPAESDSDSAKDSNKGGAKDDTEVAGSDKSDDDGNSQLWTAIGAGAAAAVLLGGGAFVVVRRRSST